MLAPFLLIGIGGSGGKTLRTARADLERQLNDLGWDKPFPDAWQFLHIDVPTRPDGLDAGLPGALPAGSYRGLVASGVNYRVIDQILSQSLRPELNFEGTAGWRPQPSQVSVAIDRGAGQYRAIGRMITITHLSEIKTAIEDAVARLNQPDVAGQLMELAALVGADEKQQMAEPVYLVVSSIAGGSGAGAVLDVTWALRAAGVSVDSAGLLLYAPDVFDAIPENQRKGVRPNALATLSELAAAWWNEEGVAENTANLYNSQGLVLPQAEGRAPGMMLIGRKNSNNLDFVEQNDVYISMGRALSAWMTSQVLQDHLTAYVTGNSAQAAAPTEGAFPAALDHQFGPFRAIGYARVSLGRNLFREYATEYLARAGVETALRKHLEQRRGDDDDRSDRQLIAEAADLAFRGFVVSCGLNERGTEYNDVLDALEPADREALYEKLRADITNQFVGSLGGGKDIAAIRTYIVNAANDFSTGYLAAERAGQFASARKWVADIQKRIMAAAAQYTCGSGALVTKEMLDRLVRDEIPFLVNELANESSEFTHYASDMESEVQNALTPAGSASIDASSPLVTDAVKKAALCLFYRAEASQRDMAVELLQDLSENFIRPLASALEGGAQLLSEDEKPKGAVPSEISMWPVGTNVPKRLHPSPNEFLLEDPETYPATLRDLVTRSVEGLEHRDAEAEVVAEILSGASQVGGLDQTMIIESRTWAPAMPELRAASQSPQRAHFEVKLRDADILDRSRDWAMDRKKVMGRYLGESLVNYLTSDSTEPGVQAERVRTFEAKFGAAMDAAQPLVAIDNRMLAQVHNQREVPVSHVISAIPFPGPSTAREAAERVLTHHGLEPGKFEFTDSTVGNVDVFTAATATLQPVVFESLMRPIASEWAAVKLNPEGRAAFWRWRRARPLPEFIPLAPQVRRAMIRGWFTASLLNRLNLPVGEAWSIYDPDDRSFQDFPFPLLQSDISQPYEYLPAVLKSIPLAWLECSAQGSLSPMRPYKVLQDLGSSGASAMISDYSINETLRHWLANGDAGDGGPSVSGAGTTSTERADFALDRINKWSDSYEKVFAQAETSQVPQSAPRAYELRADIRSAFEDLRTAVQGAKTLESATEDFN